MNDFTQMIRYMIQNSSVKLSEYTMLAQRVRYSRERYRIAKTKRPPGNRAASSSRENSSNGGFKFRQNFLREIL